MTAKALLFEVGNTIFFPKRKKMLRGLHKQGILPTEDLLHKIERQTKHEFDSLLEGNSSVDHGFWRIYYSHLLEQLGLTDVDVCDDLVTRTRISSNWCDIRPGTGEALLRLAQQYVVCALSHSDVGVW